MKVRDLIIHLMSNCDLDDEVAEKRTLNKRAPDPKVYFKKSVEVVLEYREANRQELFEIDYMK